MKKDKNQLAHDIIAIATGEKPKPVKDPAAVSMGQRGGKVRAERLSPERRKEISQKAIRARWDKS